MSKRPSKKGHLAAMVAEDGYCCMYGYIRMCVERGQDAKSMADFMGVSPRTIQNMMYRVKRANAALLGGRPVPDKQVAQCTCAGKDDCEFPRMCELVRKRPLA